MYEASCTYVDDKHVDNHDYDEETDADTDNDTGDDTDDDINTHIVVWSVYCLLYTSPSPRDKRQSRMPSSA